MLSISPELAIRMNILLRFYPLEAFQAEIRPDHAVDSNYGKRFFVDYHSKASSNHMPTVYYVKQTSFGLWKLTTSEWGL